MKEIPIGTHGVQSVVVDETNTAASMCSGALPVYGTPSLCALFEYTCFTSIEPYLDAGEGTVGVKIDISHLAATPVGMNIRAESNVISTEGRKIFFDVKAYDDTGLIGQATHERFVIYNDRFMEKAQAKLCKSH